MHTTVNGKLEAQMYQALGFKKHRTTQKLLEHFSAVYHAKEISKCELLPIENQAIYRIKDVMKKHGI